MEKTKSPSSAKRFIIYVSQNCSRRPVDCGRIQDYFGLNGWRQARKPSSADLALVFTCGSLDTMEKRSLKTISNLQNLMRESARLIVTGCLTRINPSVLLGDYTVMMPDALDGLDDLIEAKVKFSDVPDANQVDNQHDLAPLPLKERLQRTFDPSPAYFARIGRLLTHRLDHRLHRIPKHYVKIADGCLGKCSYCAIKVARGELRSKSPEAILREFKRGIDAGREIFVLVAEDMGCYGLDIGTGIIELLRSIFALEGEFRIIMKDFNPRFLVRYADDLVPLLEQNRDKIACLQPPLQSGSDRILGLMRRGYKIDEVKAVLRELKRRIPDLHLNTHVMTGFPGETEEDFRLTADLIEEFDFDEVDIYCYEDRPGLPATELEGKVPLETKRLRRKILHRMHIQNRKQKKRARPGAGLSCEG